MVPAIIMKAFVEFLILKTINLGSFQSTRGKRLQNDPPAPLLLPPPSG